MALWVEHAKGQGQERGMKGGYLLRRVAEVSQEGQGKASEKSSVASLSNS